MSVMLGGLYYQEAKKIKIEIKIKMNKSKKYDKIKNLKNKKMIKYSN